jgi:cellulose synthase/poly-beta-1,6-N-acetylglucosamine synthase-like glycosyltransferase
MRQAEQPYPGSRQIPFAHKLHACTPLSSYPTKITILYPLSTILCIVHLTLAIVGYALVLPTLPLLAELLVLTLAALFPARKLSPSGASEVRLAILVPAHNEEKLIASCLASLGNTVPIFVVAHNCTDTTATIASSAGANVLPLTDDGTHGKGAALHFGFAQAVAAGATAVLVIDADSTVSPNLIAEVTSAFAGGAAAVQVRYVAANPSASAGTRLQALAMRGVNVLRPRGRARLGLSCGIFGNGFALSITTLTLVPYLAHSIVEDLEYHLALVRSGICVDFLDAATVFGQLPDNTAAASTQRARWEGGRTMLRRRLALQIFGGVLGGRLRMFEPLLDLLSLPLTSVVILLLLALLTPARVYAGCGLEIIALYILIAALFGGEPLFDLAALLQAPFYLAFKIANLGRTRRAARGDAAWVRTERNDDASEK